MTRAERIARIKRDLQELRSRMLRIEQETFAGKRSVDDLMAELQGLEQPEGQAQA